MVPSRCRSARDPCRRKKSPRSDGRASWAVSCCPGVAVVSSFAASWRYLAACLRMPSILEVCLQSCNVGIGPPVRFGHSDPCINVVGRSIEVAKPRPKRRGTNHIKGDLKAGYDGDPLQVRRYVWPSRTDKPTWFPKEEIGGEESNGITRILQIDKSHWSPLRSSSSVDVGLSACWESPWEFARSERCLQEVDERPSPGWDPWVAHDSQGLSGVRLQNKRC